MSDVIRLVDAARLAHEAGEMADAKRVLQEACDIVNDPACKLSIYEKADLLIQAQCEYERRGMAALLKRLPEVPVQPPER